MLFLRVTKHVLAHDLYYLSTKIHIIDLFVELYLRISNMMAKISLLSGVPSLILQKLNQYHWLAICSVGCFSHLSLVYFRLIENYKNIDKNKWKTFQQVFVLVLSCFFFIHWKFLWFGACWWLRKAIFILLHLLWNIN